MSTPAIRDAVIRKFCAPEWATFFEVAAETGGRTRSADAVAMNLYQSRGLRLHGFEFKASRSDWLRELKDPAKAEPIARYMDHWWIVTLPGLVKPDEMPPTWGLYELKASGLHMVVKAPKLEARQVDAPFLAALLRRAHEHAGRDLEAEIRKRIADATAKIEERIEERVTYRTRDLERFRDAIDAFEKAAGFPLNTWEADKYGAAAKLIADLGIVGAYSHLRNVASSARGFADKFDQAFAAMGGDYAEAAE